jgi:predicted oxidoreductase (fatty acid repression mutant protein)
MVKWAGVRLTDDMTAEDVTAIFNLQAERDLYRNTLCVIAEQGCGVDQRIALAALNQKEPRC